MVDESQAVSDRVERVQGRLRAACAAAGRAPEEVTLVAVSKTRAPEEVAAAAACGLRIFGENKVQEASAKIPRCSESLEWHLIGHLQSNKARPAVRLFDVMHSVDSVSLLRRLNDEAGSAGRRPSVFLQVNVSGEASKSGMIPEALPEVLEASVDCGHLVVDGLMTMPPYFQEAEKTRPFFAGLRALRDRARDQWGFPLAHLSMGMSHDFEIAVSEGATMVRVGTDIFGPRGGRA